MKARNKEGKKRTWVRLGAYVTADPETMARIMRGSEDALLAAILEDGITLEGQAYIPGGEDYLKDGATLVPDGDVDFDFGATALEVAPKQ